MADLRVNFIPSYPYYIRSVVLLHDAQDQLSLPEILFSFLTGLLAQRAQSIKMVATA